MKKLSYYIAGLRLRTLPLSVSGIILGALLAGASGTFHTDIFCLALFTTLCLQIISNLSNEVGDMQKGTDNSNRLGPIRALQSGALSFQDYYRMIGLFIALSLLSGITLILLSFKEILRYDSILMFVLGGASIIAGIKYTMGKKPYGYQGLGDIFVFVFFGWVSTLGSFFLMTHKIPASLLLPASALGLLTTGVLNINNIRDRENDQLCGKKTIPVRIGEKNAKIYHTCLIIGAQLCMLLYALILSQGPADFLFLLTLPLFFAHLRYLWLYSGKQLDPQLKYLSLLTLTFALLSGTGFWIA